MGKRIGKYLTAVVIAIWAGHTYADRTADPDLAHTAGNGYQPVRTEINHQRQMACFKSYAAGNCDAIKKGYLDAGNRAGAAEIKDCSKPEDYSVAHYFVGCKDGGIAFVVDTAQAVMNLPHAIAGLPYKVAKGFEEQANCYQDKAYRTAILAPIKMFFKGDQGSGLVSGPKSCTELRNYVEGVIKAKAKEMADKKRNQDEYDQHIKAAPDKKEIWDKRWPEDKRKLTADEEDFKKSDEYKKRLYGLADEIVKKAAEAYQCNTTQVIAKKMCKVLTEVAAGTLTGVAIAKYGPQAISSIGNVVRRADDAPPAPRTPHTESGPPASRPPTQAPDSDIKPEVKGPARVAATEADDAARAAPRDGETPRPVVHEGETPRAPNPEREPARPSPALAAGDDVSIPRSDGTRSSGTIHRLNDDGTADVRWTENGVTREKTVPLERLRAPDSDTPGAPIGRAAATERPDNPDFNWLKTQAKTDEDIRHFLQNSPESEFKKFMGDFKPARNLADDYGIDDTRQMLRRGNFIHRLDQEYIAARAPRGLGPPDGDIVAATTKDGARHIYTDKHGNAVGHIDYDRVTPREIHIDGMRTNGQYAGRGVGDRLLADVIQSNPTVSRYAAELRFSNQAAIQRALDAGMSERQAIMQSPFYKSMQRQGFGRIISHTCRGAACDVVLGR